MATELTGKVIKLGIDDQQNAEIQIKIGQYGDEISGFVYLTIKEGGPTFDLRDQLVLTIEPPRTTTATSPV